LLDAFAETLGAALATGGFADLFGRGVAAALPEDFPADFLAGFLALFCAVVFDLKDGLRVIFDMIRIY
jgi:hypothetical protein